MNRHPAAYLFGFSGPVSRKQYAITGLLLGTLKIAVEYATLRLSTGRAWTLYELLTPLHEAGFTRPVQSNGALLFLALWTVPFVWMGASLSLRRALDADLSPWLALLFFVPFINYVVMTTLCAVPSRPGARRWTGGMPALVDGRFRAAIIGVASGVGFGVLLMLFTVYVAGQYGSVLFVGTPVLIGAITGYVQNRGHAASVSATAQASAIAVLVGSAALLGFALEGAICILMALPLAIVAALLGALLGRVIALGAGGGVQAGTAAVLLAFPAASGLEALPHALPQYQVVSSIEIDAPPEVVWAHVTGFSALPPPTELLFKTGIAYPTHAVIEGAGVGAVRRCEFTTGPFIEPVTTWEPPNRLAFDVTAQPPAMEEWSPYRHIHPPHLDGYFHSVRGEFRLVRLPGARTRLEGSTWYVLDISPVAYWRVGAEAILHTIHSRVLRHVKSLSEQEVRAGRSLQLDDLGPSHLARPSRGRRARARPARLADVRP